MIWLRTGGWVSAFGWLFCGSAFLFLFFNTNFSFKCLRLKHSTLSWGMSTRRRTHCTRSSMISATDLKSTNWKPRRQQQARGSKSTSLDLRQRRSQVRYRSLRCVSWNKSIRRGLAYFRNFHSLYSWARQSFWLDDWIVCTLSCWRMDSTCGSTQAARKHIIV